MTIAYSQFTVPSLSFALLLSAVSVPFSSRILDRLKQQREQQQQKLLEQITILDSLLAQDDSDSQTEKAIRQLQQILHNSRKIAKPEFSLTLLNTIINTYDTTDWLLGKVINRVKPQHKKSATKLMMLVVHLTQMLGQPYLPEKTIMLTKLANYWQRIGEQKAALRLLAAAFKISQLAPRLELQIRLLVPIAQEYLKLQQTAQAEEILTKSLQIAQQIQPEYQADKSIALADIASAYIKLGKTDVALEIAKSIPELYYRAYAIDLVALHLAETNQLAAALELAQTIEIVEIKGQRLLEISLIYAKRGEEELANQVFATALAGFTPEQEYAKGNLIQIYAQRGQIDAAYLVASQLKNPEVLALTLGIIAIEYMNYGKKEVAEKVIAQILTLIQTSETAEQMGSIYSILGNAVAAKQYQLAFDLVIAVKHPNFMDKVAWMLYIGEAAIQNGELEITLRFAQSLEPSYIDVRNQLLQKIALFYAQTQQMEKALAFVEQIDNSGTLPYQIETLAVIATVNGKIAESDRLLTQAIADARKLELKPQALALTIVARELLKIDNSKLADELLTAAIQLATSEQDTAVRESLLLKMEELLMTAQQYLAALQVVQANPTDTQESKLTSLVYLLVDNGNEEINIPKIYQQIKNPEIRTTGLISIAESYIRQQKKPLASEILDLAFAAAKTIPGEESRVWTFGADANGLPTTIVEDDYDRGSSLEKIALFKAQIGYYQQALHIAQVLEDKATRDKLLTKLAEYKK
ncbi:MULTISPECIES: tetratricopeptide repeat protein [Calothrix]|uniref:Tetratricopeptide repeat protein n=2 Tax=Calothrix TaxID=1186 RepID=A0ABR8AIP2_9CYAN|nr:MULTISPECIES: tetratricopeptide repeat protein [Calothrix]MBD2199148.1 tetratricopeptide repeat protein [Calothrix parietina FACHB-288]MBD2227850.1 tetratricopeptide repeat protein [Calothrix anomala FACHB-343]